MVSDGLGSIRDEDCKGFKDVAPQVGDRQFERFQEEFEVLLWNVRLGSLGELSSP
jgi:hypothetical protein